MWTSHKPVIHTLGREQRVALAWHSRGTRVALAWHSRGTRVALAWHSRGTPVALAWHSRGTRVAHPRHPPYKRLPVASQSRTRLSEHATQTTTTPDTTTRY